MSKMIQFPTSGPQIHDNYITTVAALTPYRKALSSQFKRLKVKEGGLDKLIEQILDVANGPARAHFGDEHNVKLSHEEVRDWVETNHKELMKHGIDDELALELASLYQNAASNHSVVKYGTELGQMTIEKARESVKRIAQYTGNLDAHEGHIDRTTNHQTLVRRVQQQYHGQVVSKTDELRKIEKPVNLYPPALDQAA